MKDEGKVKEILVSKLFADCKSDLGLEIRTERLSLDVPVRFADIGRPGLMLTGFSEGFPAGQIQLLGEAEIRYLEKLDVGQRASAFEGLLDKGVPCIVVAHGLGLPDPLIEVSSRRGVPVLSTPASPTAAVQYLNNYLLVELAAEISINGTLVDVYGVGILLRGKSGIGKSECALDLVERGHRLVADDLVRVIAKPPGVLIGRSCEPLQNYVEVRGIGVVDIASIFGIRSLRRQKRIEIEVNLRKWDEGLAYDRSGLEYGQVEILGVKIPSMTVPLVAGKSISVIVEVVALSHTLGLYGYNAAGTLNERLIERLRQTGKSDFVPRDIE